MKLQYLGTAAAEGTPAIFCQCSTCQKARRLGGRNIRTRAQALVDGRILLDFGLDTYLHALHFGLDLASIHTCLVTHTHTDHLIAEELEFREPWMCHLQQEDSLYIYGSAETGEYLQAKADGRILDSERSLFREVRPFEPFEAEGYRITPLPAVHGTRQPLVYVIERDGTSMLYAHDTSFFREDTWRYMTEQGMHFQLVSLDCTEGIRKIDYSGHMNIERDVEMRDYMRSLGLIDEGTRVIANHFSHNGGVTYEELLHPDVNRGLEIAYDGMTVEFG